MNPKSPPVVEVLSVLLREKMLADIRALEELAFGAEFYAHDCPDALKVAYAPKTCIICLSR